MKKLYASMLFVLQLSFFIVARAQSNSFDEFEVSGHLQLGDYKLIVKSFVMLGEFGQSSEDQNLSNKLSNDYSSIPMKRPDNYQIFNVVKNPELRSDGNCEDIESCGSLYHIKRFDRVRTMLMDNWTKELQEKTANELHPNHQRLNQESPRQTSNHRALAMTDTQILSTLYTSTNGVGWVIKNNWMVSSPCPSGNWYGVTCSGSLITGLNLDANSLQGTLPSELGLLTNIVSPFQLQRNSFYGSIPSQLGQLTSLTFGFDIGSNSLTGTLPSELGQLTSLEGYFAVYSNSILGSLPSQLGRLSAMTSAMYIYTNQFSGTLPSEIGLLSKMTALFYIHQNGFNGAIPSEIGTMSKLRTYLNFFMNSFSGSIPSELGQLTSMVAYFSLQYNQLTGTIPSELGKLSSLTRFFEINDNSISGSIPSQLFAMTGLVSTLDLSTNQLTGSLPSEVGRLTTIFSTISLETNQLSGSLPSQLGRLSLLTTYFSLESNSFSGSIPSELGQLDQLLNDFTLQFNQLTGSLPSELGRLTQLTANFILYVNSLCGDIPEEINSMIDGASLSYSSITMGNFLGSDCCIVLPWEYTCSPTPQPSVTYTPTALPTISVTCFPGEYKDGFSCFDCPVGSYSNFTEPPYPENCTVCDSGRYNIAPGSITCTECPVGKVSSDDRSYCRDCEAGEYSNNTDCFECPYGYYAPQALSKSCLACAAGFETNAVVKATTCTICSSGRTSLGYSDDCDQAESDFYFTSTSLDKVAACPNNALCQGFKFTPIPLEGYWVDHSELKYADKLNKCSRDTCKAVNFTSSCWTVKGYNATECLKDRLQCIKGSKGPLCGACESTYVYRGSTNICEECNSTTAFAFSVVALFSIITIFVVAFGTRTEVFQHIESGSLKVMWVTYQIIQSSSFTLDMQFPRPFSSMLGIMSIFSFDFLALECYNTNSDSGDIYKSTVYVWCALPIFFGIVIVAVGFIRIFGQRTSHKFWKYVDKCLSCYYYYFSAPRVHQADFSFSTKALGLNVTMEDDKLVVSKAYAEAEFLGVYVGDHIVSVNQVAVTNVEEFDLMIQSHDYSTNSLLLTVNRSTKLRFGDSKEITQRKRLRIVNQHIWLFLVLSYIVLPPVSNKQFQVFDCVEIDSGESYLRVDTSINCSSTSYLLFRNYIIAFICGYQLIPIAWMFILYRKRKALNPDTANDEVLAMFIRDNDPSLFPISFLFKDYKCDKFWFEIVDMYRRILFISILPLMSHQSTTRASFGCIFAMLSVVYIGENKPYRVHFTNTVAHVAQYSILATFFSALTVKTNSMGTLGLRGTNLGIFLVFFNLAILVLSINYAVKSYRKHLAQKKALAAMANKHEWAIGFSEGKFKTTFEAVWLHDVPNSDALLFFYTTAERAIEARRSGIPAFKRFNGIPFTLRQPHLTKRNDFRVFSKTADDNRQFPNEEVLVLSLPKQFLEPLPGYEDDAELCVLSAEVLNALRPSAFIGVVDETPWLRGQTLLPPHCIIRSFLILNKITGESDSDDYKRRRSSESSEVQYLLNKHRFEYVRDVNMGGKDVVVPLDSIFSFTKEMTNIRKRAEQFNLVPLYHYTSPTVAGLILNGGLRMSSQGQGDGGVYVSTQGPASYDIGSPEYEVNIIKDCFGVSRIDEYKGKGNLDVIIIYGCAPCALEQTPGGRENAKMFSKSSFGRFSLAMHDGTYFLRPDRIMGCFVVNHNALPKMDESSPTLLENERQRDRESVRKLVEYDVKAKANIKRLDNLLKYYKASQGGEEADVETGNLLLKASQDDPFQSIDGIVPSTSPLSKSYEEEEEEEEEGGEDLQFLSALSKVTSQTYSSKQGNESSVRPNIELVSLSNMPSTSFMTTQNENNSSSTAIIGDGSCSMDENLTSVQTAKEMGEKSDGVVLYNHTTEPTTEDDDTLWQMLKEKDKVLPGAGDGTTDNGVRIYDEKVEINNVDEDDDEKVDSNNVDEDDDDDDEDGSAMFSLFF